MLSRQEFRDANIALAVLVTVLVVGAFLVRDAGEAAMQLVGAAALIAGFGTMTFLIVRQERREKREGRDQ